MSERTHIIGADGNEVSDSNPLQVQIAGTSSHDVATVLSTTAAWANSALINTIVDVDVALPAVLQTDGLYEITIVNPSAGTALTVSVCNKRTIGVTAHYPELAAFTVGVSSKRSVLVQGWLLKEGGRLSILNQTAVGAAAAFSANVEVVRL